MHRCPDQTKTSREREEEGQASAPQIGSGLPTPRREMLPLVWKRLKRESVDWKNTGEIIERSCAELPDNLLVLPATGALAARPW